MNTPDLENSAWMANNCGIKLDEMVAAIEMKSDEEKVVFWSLFLGYAASVAVKQASPQTILIILNSLITAIHKDEINKNFH